MQPIVSTLADMLVRALASNAPANLWVDEHGRLHVTSSGGVAPVVAPAAALTHGLATVGTTAAQLSGTLVKGGQFRAYSVNVAPIWLGTSNAIVPDGSVGGIYLDPGDLWTPPDAWQDLSLLWAISSSDGQKLGYVVGA